MPLEQSPGCGRIGRDEGVVYTVPGGDIGVGTDVVVVLGQPTHVGDALACEGVSGYSSNYPGFQVCERLGVFRIRLSSSVADGVGRVLVIRLQMPLCYHLPCFYSDSIVSAHRH